MSFRYALETMTIQSSMIPQVTEQGSDRTEGVVWFVSKTEIEEAEGRLGDGIAFWPAPLAMFNETEGNGLAIWNSESGTSGMLFKDRSPLLYRWTPSAENSVNDLEKWFVDYSLSADITIDTDHSCRKTIPFFKVSKKQEVRPRSHKGSHPLTFQRKVPTVQKA